MHPGPGVDGITPGEIPMDLSTAVTSDETVFPQVLQDGFLKAFRGGSRRPWDPVGGEKPW